MNVYVIRHGESLLNVGESNSPNSGLTNTGKHQAKSLIDLFSDIQIDFIYSSPLKRVIQTAYPLALNKDKQILLVPMMSEFFNEDWTNYRDYSWESCMEITNEFKETKFISSHNTGENWWPVWPETETDVYKRVVSFYREEILKYKDLDVNIIIFGHGQTTNDLKKAINENDSTPCPNAGVFKYKIDSNGHCITQIEILSHLEVKIVD